MLASLLILITDKFIDITTLCSTYVQIYQMEINKMDIKLKCVKREIEKQRRDTKSTL